ncbi:uncharacterized protein EDB91DRAFT_277238 [Suillus paluster]|uniref:uncharacterized protein n=1 Tax=Suillus paluster TaxID=48578 RepID=UPI001B874B88|nr:uncharacterized protein EDB91DRAFT_277238 [Suillus paluster]KAG1755160.1 hypothetical protein EDB91DRAFT_277238 [Suillus paluster]
MDHNKYHIETLEQLVDAKKEAQVLRERLTRLEDAVNERDRLNVLIQAKNGQAETETRQLHERNSTLEQDVMRLQDENVALQHATEEHDALRRSLELSTQDALTKQQKVDTLEKRLRELTEEKEALTRELQLGQATARVVRVEVGVNTNPLPSPSHGSKPNGANLSVIRGASTAGPLFRARHLKQEAPATADTPAAYSPSNPSQIPATRTRLIANVPQVIPDLPDDGSTCFSRPFLSIHLGGGSQSLIVKIGCQKTLSKKFGITSYLCPNLWENPWCPTRPGMAGYMFVGLGDEIHRFVRPEDQVHELFVGVAKTNYKLMGRYQAHRVEPLTVAEWQSLPDNVRSKYCETTQRKSKDSRSVEDINAAYESGELRAPCVKLTCIDFKENLYNSLKARKTAQYSTIESSASSQCSVKRHLPARRSSNKRRRIEHEHDSDVDDDSIDCDSEYVET